MSEFIEIFKANIPNVPEEKGCVEHVLTIDVPTGPPSQELNNNVVTIIEKWGSLEDLQTHRTPPHILAYKERVAYDEVHLDEIEIQVARRA